MRNVSTEPVGTAMDLSQLHCMKILKWASAGNRGAVNNLQESEAGSNYEKAERNKSHFAANYSFYIQNMYHALISVQKTYSLVKVAENSGSIKYLFSYTVEQPTYCGLHTN